MAKPFKLRVPTSEFLESEPYQAVMGALDTLRYGMIQITVHDGKMMQVDVTEKHRFSS